MAAEVRFAAAFTCMGIFALGCSSTPETGRGRVAFQATGVVGSKILDTPSSGQYEVKPGESFLRPHEVISNAKPVYPEALLSRRLPPVEIRVRIVVNADGAVTSVTDIGATSEETRSFLTSVVTALSSWRFYPLFMIDESGRAKKLPFHQDYSFSFKQVDGKAVVVESGAQG